MKPFTAFVILRTGAMRRLDLQAESCEHGVAQALAAFPQRTVDRASCWPVRPTPTAIGVSMRTLALPGFDSAFGCLS